MLCFYDGSLLGLNDASLLTGYFMPIKITLFLQTYVYNVLMCAWIKCDVGE